MFKSGIANLPLHPGKCPRWLFPRMKKLGGLISEAIIDEYGADELLKRLSDPYFLQSLGCVIGFDWHSSGLTVTTMGALKSYLNENSLGVNIAGGKGRVSKLTLSEIEQFSGDSGLTSNKVDKLQYASKTSAKVDSSLVQDGYQLYHHTIAFSEKGKWTVVQQGMNTNNRYARRYHWISDNVNSFTETPHSAICCDENNRHTLNMTAKENNEARKISLDLVKEKNVMKYFNVERKQALLSDFTGETAEFTMPRHHEIINMNKVNLDTLKRAYEIQPSTYEELLNIKGVGAKTIRSLALVSEMIFGTNLNWKDPVKYSYAHGGKDGIPYPVDRQIYDKSIDILRNAVNQAKLNENDKMNAIKRLKHIYL